MTSQGLTSLRPPRAQGGPPSRGGAAVPIARAMSGRVVIVLVCALIAATLTPGAAAAGPQIISPTDGATVGSQPLIVTSGGARPGSIDTEVATDATLLTAGPRAGAFVDPVDSDIAFFGDDTSLAEDTVKWGPGRLVA